MNVLDDGDFHICCTQLVIGDSGGTRDIVSENDVIFAPARCSVTFVKCDNPNIMMLVDCGSPWEKDQLLESLRRQNVQADEITHLAITHWHFDHCGIINQFPSAKLITPNDVKIEDGAQIHDDIEIALYSGHTDADLVVYVTQRSIKKEGMTRRIAIAGDIFERENDWLGQQLLWKTNSMNVERQNIARLICWKKSDIIIPGHGKAFAVKTNFPTDNDTEIMKVSGWNLKSDPSAASATVKKILRFEDDQGQQYYIYLIRFHDDNILVNTGPPSTAFQRQLTEVLQRESLLPDDIGHVVLTEPAPNFCGNISIFPCAKHYMYDGVASGPGPSQQSGQQTGFYSVPQNATDTDQVTLKYCIPINEAVTVWRDCNKFADRGRLSVVVRLPSPSFRFSIISGQLEEFILLFLDIPRDSCRFMPTWKLAGEPDNLARRNFSSHAIPDNEPMDQNDAEMYDDEQETGDETNDINMPE